MGDIAGGFSRNDLPNTLKIPGNSRNFQCINMAVVCKSILKNYRFLYNIYRILNKKLQFSKKIIFTSNFFRKY